MKVTQGQTVPGRVPTASSLFSTCSSTRFHRGDVLVTTATGVMTEEEGERWGLVPTHAYAVLDVREFKVSQCRLVVTLTTCITVFSNKDQLITSLDPCVFPTGHALPAAEESLEPPALEGALQRARRQELDPRPPEVPQL